MEIQQQKIYALLDFVMECNRNHRFTSRILEPENYFVAMMEDAVLDSAIIGDSLTVSSPSEDENEVVNLPKEQVEDNLHKFRPPRKGLSAIRSFPLGCGRGASTVRIQHGSKCLQNNGSRAKNRRYDEAATKVAKKSRASICYGVGPITHRTESEDHKILEDSMKNTSGNEDGHMEGKFSRKFDNVKSELGGLATGPEPMVKRVVVQALNAGSNCPWRQGKRIFK